MGFHYPLCGYNGSLFRIADIFFLVRNWEFQHPTPNGLGGGVNPLKLLRRRSSLVVDDLPPNGLQRGLQQDKAGPRVNAPPTTFEEPDAGSLLDSFGF